LISRDDQAVLDSDANEAKGLGARHTKTGVRLSSMVLPGALTVAVMYVLSEGPARWLIDGTNLEQNDQLRTGLVWSYQPVVLLFECLPKPVEDVRERYLDWFAPNRIDGSFLHLD
jgi:hypothetical protein